MIVFVPEICVRGTGTKDVLLSSVKVSVGAALKRTIARTMTRMAAVTTMAIQLGFNDGYIRVVGDVATNRSLIIEIVAERVLHR